MKSTGIIRRIDGLGRVVLPIELRRTLDLDIKDPVEIFVEGESIVLRKYEAACIFAAGQGRDLIPRQAGMRRLPPAAAGKVSAWQTTGPPGFGWGPIFAFQRAEPGWMPRRSTVSRRPGEALY